jgi:hypothetical protein
MTPQTQQHQAGVTFPESIRTLHPTEKRRCGIEQFEDILSDLTHTDGSLPSWLLQSSFASALCGRQSQGEGQDLHCKTPFPDSMLSIQYRQQISYPKQGAYKEEVIFNIPLAERGGARSRRSGMGFAACRRCSSMREATSLQNLNDLHAREAFVLHAICTILASFRRPFVL